MIEKEDRDNLLLQRVGDLARFSEVFAFTTFRRDTEIFKEIFDLTKSSSSKWLSLFHSLSTFLSEKYNWSQLNDDDDGKEISDITFERQNKMVFKKSFSPS